MLGKLEEIPEAHKQELENWRPERSNCPELTLMIDNFIKRIPIAWRDVAREIFVGRVPAGEIQATAWTEKHAGLIELNVQFTWVLSAYVDTYDEFYFATRGLIEEFYRNGSDPAIEAMAKTLQSRLLDPWDRLDEKKLAWRDPRLIESGTLALVQSSRPGREEARMILVSACEEYILAHELAHHLLGHLVKNRGKARAREVVNGYLRDDEIWKVYSPLNKSQKDEFEADILAYLLVANGVDRAPEQGYMYRAVLSSAMTQIALAHVKEGWVYDAPDATHPNFFQRFSLIQRLTEILSAGMPRGVIGDHPMSALGQVETFSAVALHHWRSQVDNEVSPAGIYEVVDLFFKRFQATSRKIGESYPEGDDGEFD
ncbi:M48 family metalloprotease [Actinoplanes sp. RD1]|uniref:hypothetical protein n=1 Tax=Actinoplanes sp. RD1 TaxID=3064538 RepID=UPI002741B8E4|nr:hypothetical protein [Actinoplanes sp. RD1]